MTPNSDKPINSEEVRCKWCSKLKVEHFRPYFVWWCTDDKYSDDRFTIPDEPIDSVSPASTKEEK